MSGLSYTFPDEAALLTFGGKLAVLTKAPLVISLEGQLGAGKTTLARGFLQGLGFQGKVKSPSYTLVESYSFQDKSIYHFDFYRIQNPQELDFIGLQDYWQPTSVFLIEWAEKAGGLLPPVDLICRFELEGVGRRVFVEGRSKLGEQLLSRLKNAPSSKEERPLL